jgi:hypothetical protein
MLWYSVFGLEIPLCENETTFVTGDLEYLIEKVKESMILRAAMSQLSKYS